MTVTEQLRDEARAYYALCARAEAVGIPTSLDDPNTPATIAELHAQVAAAELSAALGELRDAISAFVAEVLA